MRAREAARLAGQPLDLLHRELGGVAADLGQLRLARARLLVHGARKARRAPAARHLLVARLHLGRCAAHACHITQSHVLRLSEFFTPDIIFGRVMRVQLRACHGNRLTWYFYESSAPMSVSWPVPSGRVASSGDAASVLTQYLFHSVSSSAASSDDLK